MPVPPANVALFIAYLFNLKYAPATTNTYVSAIGYYHRIAGLADPTKVPYIVEMLKGYTKIGKTIDSRLPITLPILRQIVRASTCICTTYYDKVLFQAMCSFAFFAFLRIGVITVSQGPANNVIQINQLFKVMGPDNEVCSLKLAFQDYKHHYNQPATSLLIARQTILCPVQSMLDYLSLRTNSVGPIFVSSNGRPVSRSYFTRLLRSCFKACNLDPTCYKGHSFRIGAATYAAQQGFSDAKIRALGRWKSDAFKRYIRTQTAESL